MRSSGEIAQVNESFTMSKGEAPILELNAAERGHIRVRGWDRADYSVETCKIAAAETRGEAEQMARGISVGLPPDGSPTRDRPVRLRGVDGRLHRSCAAGRLLESGSQERTHRGARCERQRQTAGQQRPIAIADCGGTVEAHTTNGPIAFSGDRGEVHLNAQNGPIAVKLATETWNGSQLEARTINGPLAVSVPEHFRSGMRLETSGRAPVSCSATETP